MKRYTGQQALYEAISRSRAKTKQGSILERLRPEPAKPEDPADQPSPPTEPQQRAEPGAQEAAEPQVVETPPMVEQEPQAKLVVEMPLEPLSEALPAPMEQSEPVVMSRPVERAAHPMPSPVQPWLRPRPVQLNEGRIEISVPYYIGVIAGLAVLVVVLAAFRLGQARSGGQANDAARQVQPVADKTRAPANPPTGSTPQNVTTANTGLPQSNPAAPGATRPDVAPASAKGDHWIVLASYKRQEDLDLVRQHFAEHGILLLVLPLDVVRTVFAEQGLNPGLLPSGDGFLLVTKDYVNNPKVSGTDGDKLKKRIVEVGALYRGKAPSGYESFAPNYFSDAYPMKIR